MERVSLEAEVRTECGTRGVKRLRRFGKVPAVLYGHKVSGVGLAIDALTVEKLFGHEGFHGIIDLKVKGDATLGQSSEPLLVLVKDYQADKLTRYLTHIDFYKVDLKEKVTVQIPIHVEGVAPGVKAGGVIDISRRELTVRCLPHVIPDYIAVDISTLNIGDSIHVKDLKVPEGVEIEAETNFTIVAVAVPAKEEEAPVAAAPEGAAPAEGAVPAEGAATPVASEKAKEEKS